MLTSVEIVAFVVRFNCRGLANRIQYFCNGHAFCCAETETKLYPVFHLASSALPCNVSFGLVHVERFPWGTTFVALEVLVWQSRDGPWHCRAMRSGWLDGLDNLGTIQRLCEGIWYFGIYSVPFNEGGNTIQSKIGGWGKIMNGEG